MNHIPFKEITALNRVALQTWQNDRALRVGAALAYYIALSLASTVLILLAIASLAFGTQAAEGPWCLRSKGSWDTKEPREFRR
jgi:membrane protein